MVSMVQKRRENRRLFNFVITESMADGLKAVKEREGISESAQVRLAVEAWLRARGIHVERNPTTKGNGRTARRER